MWYVQSALPAARGTSIHQIKMKKQKHARSISTALRFSCNIQCNIYPSLVPRLVRGRGYIYPWASPSAWAPPTYCSRDTCKVPPRSVYVCRTRKLASADRPFFYLKLKLIICSLNNHHFARSHLTVLYINCCIDKTTACSSVSPAYFLVTWYLLSEDWVNAKSEP